MSFSALFFTQLSQAVLEKSEIYTKHRPICILCFQAGVIVTRSPAQMGGELLKALRQKNIA